MKLTEHIFIIIFVGLAVAVPIAANYAYLKHELNPEPLDVSQLLKPYTNRLIADSVACMQLPILSEQYNACFKAAENRCLTAMMADKSGSLDDCKID
jgi:hypothetical protein